MRMLLVAAVLVGTATAPASAQAVGPQKPATEQPETVTKVVCERTRDGETGSRVGSTRKVCRKIQVPANNKDAKKAEPHEQGTHAG